MTNFLCAAGWHGSAIAAWLTLPEPFLATALAHEGFDAIALDMQHGAIDITAAIGLIHATAARSKPAIVRIPLEGFQVASQLLDFGANAIIVPMVNSVEDAQRLVAAVKYPPLGQRSWGPHRALALSGCNPADYLQLANKQTAAFAMIETREVITALPDILSVAGIDGVFVGPAPTSSCDWPET